MIIELSASEIVAKIKSRELGVVEVAQAFIDRVKEVNPVINAIHQFDPTRILKEAAAKDEVIAKGEPLGRLHGLPISLKDAFYAPGFKGAKGNVALFQKSGTDRAATAVQRLLDEGAIILGITNAPEFCAGFETDNLLNGRTHNPYNHDKVSGGSSGGEASLIATGGSCVGLGSDAGGSIRQPAHYCGIAGFKPTKGRVPTTGNIPEDVGGLHTPLLTFGPMSRHVEDIALILSVIEGPDGKDPLATFQPAPSDMKSVDTSTLKAKCFFDNGVVAPDQDTLRVLKSLVQSLKDTGMHVNEISPPDILKDTFKLVWDTCFYGGDAGATMLAMLKAIGQQESSPMLKQHLTLMHGSFFDTAELRNRIAKQFEYKKKMLEFMGDADILICPVAATPARDHGTTHDNLTDYTYAMMSNLTGWPAASINCGFAENGLPIGIQIIAKPWNDHLVLAYSKLIQGIVGIPPIVTPSATQAAHKKTEVGDARGTHTQKQL